MDRIKYILFQDLDGLYIPVIFSSLIKHSDVARAHARQFRHEVHSAGFVYFNEDGKVVPYGRSESLNVDTKPDTAALMNMGFGLNQ